MSSEIDDKSTLGLLQVCKTFLLFFPSSTYFISSEHFWKDCLFFQVQIKIEMVAQPEFEHKSSLVR